MISSSSNPTNLLKKQSEKSNPPLPKQSQEISIVEQIAQINLLRQTMLQDTHNFDLELNQLQRKLVKKANQLQIVTSQEMMQISDNNLALVQQFVNYQQTFIKKLEQKNSNWDKFELELNTVETKLDNIMSTNQLVPKLALIEIIEGQVEKLIDEVQQLKKQKENRKSSQIKIIAR